VTTAAIATAEPECQRIFAGQLAGPGGPGRERSTMLAANPQKAHRAWLFYQAMRRGKGFDVASRRQARARAGCLEFIQSSVEDASVRASVTPDYPWGCEEFLRRPTATCGTGALSSAGVPRAMTRPRSMKVTRPARASGSVEVLRGQQEITGGAAGALTQTVETPQTCRSA
jgi:hypothetical protein